MVRRNIDSVILSLKKMRVKLFGALDSVFVVKLIRVQLCIDFDL